MPPASGQRAPLRALVVGAGRIAEQHLSAIDRLSAARLVGVCDPSTTLAQHAVARFGGAAYGELGAALDTERPDVVHVLTPAHLHVPVASAALKAGAHVLVEKPMSLDEQGREELLSAAASAGRLLVEDHNYRFNRPMLSLLEAARSGAIGDLVDVEVEVTMPLQAGNRYHDANLPSPSHALPTGFIHEFITHMAYLAVSIDPALRVHDALWRKQVAGHASRFDAFDARLTGTTTTGRLRFSSMGPRAEIAVTATGTTGRAEAEVIFGSFRTARPRGVGQQLGPSADALPAATDRRRPLAPRATGHRLAGLRERGSRPPAGAARRPPA